MNNSVIKDLGLVSYNDVYKIQTDLFNNSLKMKKNEKKISDTIIFCEHPHVYTIGKSGNRNNLLINDKKLREINAEFVPVNRGGDITYHGPGQIVIYPIIDLDEYHMGVKDYIYFLEFLIVDILKEYGIKGEISPGNIGVWLDVGKLTERKICAVGVKVSRKITMHGIALNVNTDLSYFNFINPCGFTEKGVTSVKKELCRETDLNTLKSKIGKEFILRLKSMK